MTNTLRNVHSLLRFKCIYTELSELTNNHYTFKYDQGGRRNLYYNNIYYNNIYYNNIYYNIIAQFP